MENPYLNSPVIAALVVSLIGACAAYWVIGPTARANAREVNAVVAYNDLLTTYAVIASNPRPLQDSEAIERFLVAKLRIAVFGAPEVLDAVSKVNVENHALAMVDVVRQMRVHVGYGEIDYRQVEELIDSASPLPVGVRVD